MDTNNQPTTTSNFMDTISDSIPDISSGSSDPSLLEPTPLGSDTESIFSKPSTWIVMFLIFIGIISLGVFYFIQTIGFDNLLKQGKEIYNLLIIENEEDEIKLPTNTHKNGSTGSTGTYKRHTHTNSSSSRGTSSVTGSSIIGSTGSTGSTGSRGSSNLEQLYKALDSAASAYNKTQEEEVKENWCYVGLDNEGTRSCSSVVNSVDCMSGNVFPSRTMCINNTLRV
jgi:hypothetical protein